MQFDPRMLTTRTGRFILFKYVVYTLLLVNVYLFAVNGTFTETTDSAAWLLILGLFEWETRSIGNGRHAGRLESAALVLLSIVGYAVILYACYRYYAEREWLDFANSFVWILVALILEYDVLVPGNYSKLGWLSRNVAKTVLYGALLVFAVIWGVLGDVLDFYDAFLWIVAFVVIEMNIFGFEHSLVEKYRKGGHLRQTKEARCD